MQFQEEENLHVEKVLSGFGVRTRDEMGQHRSVNEVMLDVGRYLKKSRGKQMRKSLTDLRRKPFCLRCLAGGIATSFQRGGATTLDEVPAMARFILSLGNRQYYVSILRTKRTLDIDRRES